MSTDDTARELEKLRADVAALSDARREAASRPAEPSPAEAAPLEEQMVREIREMAAEEISKDISAVTDELAVVGAGLRQLKTGVSAFGSGGGAMGALGPVLPLVIDLLRKGKK